MARSSSPQPRYGGSKVRTGCVTCKARRVKCDEGKPACHRCLKSDRACGGYSSLPKPGQTSSGGELIMVNYVPPRQLLPATSWSDSPSIMPYLDRREQRSLEYFRTYTAEDLAGSFTSVLWSKLLLQVSVHESAIRHAVIALGALHECFVTQPDLRAANSTFAMQQYGKAIQQLVKPGAADLDLTADTVLLACILFTAFESLCGHYRSALTHLNSGIAVLHEQNGHRKQPSYVSLDLLNLLFIRLHTQSLEIGDIRTKPAHAPPIVELSPPTTFADLAEAVVHMNLNLYQFTSFVDRLDTFEPAAGAPVSVPAKPSLTQACAQHVEHAKYATFVQSHLGWCTAFDRFLENNPHTGRDRRSYETQQALIILQIWRLLVDIVLNFDFRAGEMGWDEHLDEFKELTRLAESFDSKVAVPAQAASARPTFSLSLGIITPLYFTGSRCRDSRTRRRALKVLQASRRKEGVWDSLIAASVLVRLIAIEEGSARAAVEHSMDDVGKSGVHDADYLTADQIPEASRIVLVATAFGIGKQGLIKYRVASATDVVTELVEW